MALLAMQSDKLPSSTVLDEFVRHFEASVAPWCNNVTIGPTATPVCDRGIEMCNRPNASKIVILGKTKVLKDQMSESEATEEVSRVYFISLQVDGARNYVPALKPA